MVNPQSLMGPSRYAGCAVRAECDEIAERTGRGTEGHEDDANGRPLTNLPWPADAPLFASGTDALAALLRWGAARHGWSRVWLPSYYCPDVPAALRRFAGVDVLAYPDHDLEAAPAPVGQMVPGDVVVVANQLGVRRQPASGAFSRTGAVVIDDHSHDLGSDWARHSSADYAFASLRKTLPVPDGGVVWSPSALDLPPEPALAGGGASARRLAAAVERRGALAGVIRTEPLIHDEPLTYRALARVAATARPPAGGWPRTSPPGAPDRPGISPVSRTLLAQMPVGAWRDRRRANVEILTRAIGTAHGARVLSAPDGCVAFALTLVAESAAVRARLQDALAARAVVPIVLWPLDRARDPGARAADADLSRRILSVHADQRFTGGDMAVLAGILREALRSV